MIIDDLLTKKIIKPRPLNSHKGTFGRVLLIGGNYPYGGAIIMAALACVNSGAGLVTVATHKDNITALHSHLPEAMAFDMVEKDRLSEQITAADVVLMGPGLAEDDLAQTTFDVVWQAIKPKQTLIIDGSAINLLAKRKPAIWPTKQIILTPHQKEWERLSGLTIPEQIEAATQTAPDDRKSPLPVKMQESHTHSRHTAARTQQSRHFPEQTGNGEPCVRHEYSVQQSRHSQ